MKKVRVVCEGFRSIRASEKNELETPEDLMRAARVFGQKMFDKKYGRGQLKTKEIFSGIPSPSYGIPCGVTYTVHAYPTQKYDNEWLDRHIPGVVVQIKREFYKK